MAIFKTVPANIPQIKATIEAFGPVWFHGDGNIFTVKQDDEKKSSLNRATFFNDRQSEASYRVRFNSVGEVPDSVEQLNDLLDKAKHVQDLEREKTAAEKPATQTVVVPGQAPAKGPKVVTTTAEVKAQADYDQLKSKLTTELSVKQKELDDREEYLNSLEAELKEKQANLETTKKK